MIRAHDMADAPIPTSMSALPVTAGLTVELTRDHRYRGRALAVPGAYWSRARQAYAVDNPNARAAGAIMALFPEVLVEHPEVADIRQNAYETARPHNYANELGLTLGLDDNRLPGGLKLYDWQDSDGGYIKAIMERDGGAHVGWDRGLGKTVLTAALIQATEAQRTLIFARNDAKEAVWLRQISEYLPEHDVVLLPDSSQKSKQLRALDYIAAHWDRQNRMAGGQQGDRPLVVIAHYQAIRTIAGNRETKHRDGTTDVVKGGGKGWDRLGSWDLCAYDESHRLASYNPNSSKNTQEGRALSYLRRKHIKLALNLSGSAIMNRPDDLYGQLHFLYPHIYRSKWADWNNRVVDYVQDGHRRLSIGWKLDALPGLRRELGVFMVYRHKTDKEVNLNLPPLIHQDIELSMLPDQQRVYNQVRDEFWARTEEEGIKVVNAMDLMNKLRQIATAWPGVESAKLDFAVNEIEEESDAQFVVFTWYKRPGHALAERLGDDVVVVDGDVPARHRAELLRRHKDGQVRVLVGSIATLGESLNLQYCHEAIRLDRSWNPEANGQTTDRLYRQGQQARVTFRDLWTKGSVDMLRVMPNLKAKESLRKALFV